MGYSELRALMVRDQLAARGIRNRKVLDAMAMIPREDFVPDDYKSYAYDDGPLPIGNGQTISQPYIVARMTEALHLKQGDKVLEIGTGSGYAAAILASVAGRVYTIERIESLAEKARCNLGRLQIENVVVKQGDGTLGWPENAPYDAIVVTAGGPHVPRPLMEQLAIGGRLVIPTGKSEVSQHLVRVLRESEEEYREEDIGAVRFVPLIGEQGWQRKTA